MTTTDTTTDTIHTMPTLNIDRNSVLTAGCSNTADFATQFHVAFSSLVTGACIFSGMPYHCAVTRFPGDYMVPKSPSTSAGIHCPDCDANGTLIYDHCKNHPRWVVSLAQQSELCTSLLGFVFGSVLCESFLLASCSSARDFETHTKRHLVCTPSPSFFFVIQDVDVLAEYAKSADNVDDPVVHLAGARVFSFGPTHDRCYQPPAMENVANFYKIFVEDESQVKLVEDQPFPHTLPTNSTPYFNGE